MINTVFEVRGGEVCVDPIVKHKASNMAAIAETLPTKLCIEFGSVSPLPGPRDNKGSLILDCFQNIHRILNLVMINDITIIKMRINIQGAPKKKRNTF